MSQVANYAIRDLETKWLFSLNIYFKEILKGIKSIKWYIDYIISSYYKHFYSTVYVFPNIIADFTKPRNLTFSYKSCFVYCRELAPSAVSLTRIMGRQFTICYISTYTKDDCSATASRRSLSRFLVAERSTVNNIDNRQRDWRREQGTAQDDAARPERTFQCVYQQEIKIADLLVYQYQKAYPTTFQTQNNPNMHTNLCKYMKYITMPYIIKHLKQI